MRLPRLESGKNGQAASGRFAGGIVCTVGNQDGNSIDDWIGAATGKAAEALVFEGERAEAGRAGEPLNY